ncbi:MAG: transposase [Epsilonproteobacteria bacterium]|nr:transposase [Campylobacterota bacterium]
MLGISRWEEKFSYKTVERFFDEKIDWLKLSWAFIKSEIGEEVILVADETTVSKSGKSTFGIDYFYSGVTHSVIKSISFLGFSLVDVKTKRSFPLLMKQIVKEPKKDEIKDT